MISLEDADLIADMVVTKLNQHVISAVLPERICEAIRNAARHHSIQWINNIPLEGPNSLRVEYILRPDGGLQISFSDMNASQFWRGEFVPASRAVQGMEDVVQ